MLAGETLPPADRAALPLARLGGRRRRHHRADLLSTSSTTRRPFAARRRRRARPVRLSAQPAWQRRPATGATSSPRCSAASPTACRTATCCATSSTRSTASISQHRRDPHPRPPLRDDAPGDARRRRRLRRVLHAAGRRAVHGRGRSTRSSARRCSTRPAAPAAFWSRHSSTWKPQCRHGREAPNPAANDVFRRRGEAAAVPALPDELAAARPGGAGDRSGQRLRFQLSEIGDARSGRRDPDQSAVRRRGGSGHLSAISGGQADRETALLFLQLIMRRLEAAAATPGVPASSCRTDALRRRRCARIKEELLEQFNLHTVVRLPNGVFAPYTDIPTNILFFERPGRRETSGTTNSRCRKAGGNTPRRSRCNMRSSPIAWPGGKPEGRAAGMESSRPRPDQARRAGALIAVDLDLKNPHAKDAIDHRCQQARSSRARSPKRTGAGSLERDPGAGFGAILVQDWYLPVPLGEFLSYAPEPHWGRS